MSGLVGTFGTCQHAAMRLALGLTILALTWGASLQAFAG